MVDPVAAQIPQQLWNGLFPTQQPQVNNLSPFQQMLEMHQQRTGPQFVSREIDPGRTWGGRDRNAIDPQALMQMYFAQRPPENL